MFAQETTETKPTYPQDYFRNPLDIPIFLAGNFGECRPGHFHSGIDIKTLGKEGQPVHAAADGYISRIKMEKGGFGHGLYITHPNGYTTLYAHLSDFAPAIQQYLKKEQYEKKHWDVDIQLSSDQFPVKKGDQIAWSGNTGASTAPHLHFEIRDTKTEHPLNPELFGLPLVDKIAPVPTEVVFYEGNIYWEGKVTTSLKKADSLYKPDKTDNRFFSINMDTMQVPAGLIGIGINVNDYMDGSDNTIAFYTARLYMDDSLQAQITLDDIGYDETRYINAYADYKTKEISNKWVQCLFKLPGNRLDEIYSCLNNNKGRLDFNDRKVHKIDILLTDDKGNKSNVFFYAKPTLKDEMMPGDDRIPFYANKANDFIDKNIKFSLDSRQLYDDIFFNFKGGNCTEIPEILDKPKAAEDTTAVENTNLYSCKFQLHHSYVPIHHYFDLKIKPNKPIPANLKNKIAMLYSDDKDIDGRAAIAIDSGWYKAKVRAFGTYWLDIDTVSPVIKSLQKDNSNLSKASQITFEVKDAMTSVKSFSGYLDGKWICFEQHNDLFFYKFDEHCPKGKHKLVFRAEDENGNATSTSITFVR